MTETTKLTVKRRRLTVADRLKELDEQYAVRAKRDDALVEDAQARLEGYEADRTAHRVAYQERRSAIVNAALKAAADLKAQAEGVQP